MSELFYHYTSLNVLYNIVSNNELWLSNLKNSNDPNEFYLSSEEYNNYVKENTATNPYLVFPIIKASQTIVGNPYGISLTTLEDDLGHWARYGDQSRGVAIAFDIATINEFLEEHYDFAFDFDSIKYTEEEKINFIKELIDKMTDFEGIAEEYLSYPATYYTIHYSLARALFKKESFKIEKEYRLYVDLVEREFHKDLIKIFLQMNPDELEKFCQESAKQKQDLRLTDDNKKYALMRNGINSYLSLDLSLLGNKKENLIKKIILGPKSTQNVEELNAFLKKNGFETTIHKSQIEIC